MIRICFRRSRSVGCVWMSILHENISLLMSDPWPPKFMMSFILYSDTFLKIKNLLFCWSNTKWLKRGKPQDIWERHTFLWVFLLRITETVIHDIASTFCTRDVLVVSSKCVTCNEPERNVRVLRSWSLWALCIHVPHISGWMLRLGVHREEFQVRPYYFHKGP